MPSSILVMGRWYTCCYFGVVIVSITLSSRGVVQSGMDEKVFCLLSSRLWGASNEIAINKKRQANDFILDATTCDILLGYSLHEVMLAKHIRG